MSDYMLVQSVIVEPKGSTLTTAASISDTELAVDNAQDFDDEGGTLDLNGARLQYTSIVEGINPTDPDTINLAEPLAVGADEDDAVSPVVGNLIPEDWYAVGSMGDQGDEVHVPIDVDQRSQWPVGEYPDPVPVRVSDDLLHIEDAPGRTVSSRNAFRNTDEYTYDGVAADIRLPLTKIPISGSEQPFWKAATVAVGGVGLPPGSWRIESAELIVDDADLMAEFDTDDLFWVDYAYDAAAADIVRPDDPPGFADEVLIDGPILYWRLDEPSGTVALDSSGNGNDGTYVGGPTLGAPSLLSADSDPAVEFDGADDTVNFSPLFSSDPTASFAFWVKKTAPPAATEYAFYGIGPGQQYWFSFHSDGTTEAHFDAFGVGGTQNVAGPSIADGDSHFIVMTYDDATNTGTLYVDGVSIGTATSTGVVDAVEIFVAGSSTTIFFEGVVDEFVCYDTVLSPGRVAALYAAGTI